VLAARSMARIFMSMLVIGVIMSYTNIQRHKLSRSDRRGMLGGNLFVCKSL
jgi:hypothetical protein